MNEKRICGVIFGRERSDLLSLAEEDDSLLMPFAPSYRNIDYAISSLFHIGISDFIVFVSKKKRIEEYFIKNWGELNVTVIDCEELGNNLHFIREKIDSLDFSMFIGIKSDNPLWVNFEEYKEKIFTKEISFSIKNKNGKKAEVCGFSIKPKEFTYKFLTFINNKELFTKDIATEWHNINKLHSIEIEESIFLKINSIKEFFDFHINMINNYFYLDDFNSKVPLKYNSFVNSSSVFDPDSFVKNSIVGTNVEIKGYVENSVIFSNVRIAKGAKIINSLILPGNNIGSHTVIDSVILDEFYEDNSLPNIEAHSVIGNKEAIRPNNKFGELNFGVSLLGKNLRIPSRMKIGGNCYIKSNVYHMLLRNMRNIEDGSLVSN
ncbi:MAG: hypothetical protein N2258_04255 [Brevinematales bacterium]|nr:hypothetical protein [Brevinematales bacterium]